MIGIYKITNLINNKIYIGQSIDIEKRYKNHIYFSKNPSSREYNTPIHAALRYYGENNFKIEILEKCKKEELDEREIYYINKFSSNNREIGYNLTNGGDGRKGNAKSILQYDLQGNLLKEWDSILEASENLKISQANIRSCCCGQKSAGGYQWKYKNDNNKIIGEYKKNTYLQGLELGRKKKEITAISTKDHNKIKFNSIIDGAKFLIENSLSKSSIASLQSRISTVKNKKQICCGFYWETGGE